MAHLQMATEVVAFYLLNKSQLLQVTERNYDCKEK